MTEFVLHHWPRSRSTTAMWMLEETGADYRLELVNIGAGEQKRPEYLAVNPMGKVPALVHGQVVVTEVPAICAYLADAFPEAGLAPPPGSPERGAYYRWLFFMGGVIEPAVSDHIFKRPAFERPEAIGHGTYAQAMATLDAALAPGPWLLGERFSAADVAIGSTLSWFKLFGTLPEGANFARYVEAVEARPAYRRYAEKNFALMPA